MTTTEQVKGARGETTPEHFIVTDIEDTTVLDPRNMTDVSPFELRKALEIANLFTGDANRPILHHVRIVSDGTTAILEATDTYACVRYTFIGLPAGEVFLDADTIKSLVKALKDTKYVPTVSVEVTSGLRGGTMTVTGPGWTISGGSHDLGAWPATDTIWDRFRTDIDLASTTTAAFGGKMLTRLAKVAKLTAHDGDESIRFELDGQLKPSIAHIGPDCKVLQMPVRV